MAAATLSVRPNRLSPGSPIPGLLAHVPNHPHPCLKPSKSEPWRVAKIVHTRRTLAAQAGSRADDSAPFEMSVENAFKLLGVSESASFDDILRAKNSIVASIKDDQEAIAQSLTQRRAGKVMDRSIRYADVKPVNPPGVGSMPQWVQTTVKNLPVSVGTPSTGDLGIQAGVYGALMVLTYVNGASTSSVIPYTGPEVPGFILASSFGASLYFMTRKNVKLGKATLITIGGLVAGAVVGSAVENWLQVDIVPFVGINSPGTVVSEFILFSQFLVSLYLR
ncbi:protein CHAPERONE-LIKE PROTEIN OF POR1, chloroplastic-like isoform X2 [Durio zibethinus]|uniref:Protein CHAPERONE-LIKE PROTEIN OF POR1, chloroplastic-like isoform X2 n=1 Tax=Durio zibethinus TaxID=66656 RepID=A0A6P6ADR2_DURZI|nr:protein CHAPERONE-LIKE PROTEIN OF POR1, chloroplastic-like isoform X2 [Durio zibethinus]